jgi:four helix bundle protein
MKEKVQKRTFELALEIVRLCGELPQKQEFWVIGKQLIRSATSVGANYRAVSRAKSGADFVHKLTVVEEEADESIFWMELLCELDIDSALKTRLESAMMEMDEVLRIVVASIRTMKERR